jgi:hypothetical protein
MSRCRSKIEGLNNDDVCAPVPRSGFAWPLNLSGFPTSHLNPGIDGIFERVPVLRRGFIAISKVHPVATGVHLPQREAQMACDRFGLRERGGLLKSHLGSSRDTCPAQAPRLGR